MDHKTASTLKTCLFQRPRPSNINNSVKIRMIRANWSIRNCLADGINDNKADHKCDNAIETTQCEIPATNERVSAICHTITACHLGAAIAMRHAPYSVTRGPFQRGRRAGGTSRGLEDQLQPPIAWIPPAAADVSNVPRQLHRREEIGHGCSLTDHSLSAKLGCLMVTMMGQRHTDGHLPDTSPLTIPDQKLSSLSSPLTTVVASLPPPTHAHLVTPHVSTTASFHKTSCLGDTVGPSRCDSIAVQPTSAWQRV